MKIKQFLTIIFTLVGLTYFTQDASANTIDASDASANIIDTEEEFLSQIKMFDENGEQIPYTMEELEQIFTYIPEGSMNTSLTTPFAAKKSTYNTKAFNFKDNIWVNGGAGFYNPTNISITPTGSKAFSMIMYNKDHGTEVHRLDVPEGLIGGFAMHLGLTSYARGYSYSFQFKNFFSGTVYMTNVSIDY
ncbi:hypothetical protein [Bacillus toyonensis]|uniref:hypothetical protein n=1 Tax=Bacillus toyonensis TaxID=155322 RepID=UPI0028530795|nr:hypothetical protein [Bacillus toyonensis]MDR4974607.1 hypothetical protein [Bacillus toyonensis]